MTGRAAGLCAGFGVPGYMNMAMGRGMGLGYGRGRGAAGWRSGGRGWRNMFYATGLPGWARGVAPAAIAPEQELAVLKQQAESLGQTLEQIRKRIEEVEAKPADR